VGLLYYGPKWENFTTKEELWKEKRVGVSTRTCY